MKEVEQILRQMGIPFLLRLGGAALVLLFGVAILQVIRRNFALFFAQRPYSPETIRATYLGIQIVGWLAIILVLLRIAGVQIQMFSAIFFLLVVALAVALGAAWHVAAAFVSGTTMTKAQPFQIGDVIEVIEPSGAPGPMGRVIAFNYLNTTLEQSDPETGRIAELTVPNSLFYRKSIRCEPGTQRTPLKPPPLGKPAPVR